MHVIHKEKFSHVRFWLFANYFLLVHDITISWLAARTYLLVLIQLFPTKIWFCSMAYWFVGKTYMIWPSFLINIRGRRVGKCYHDSHTSAASFACHNEHINRSGVFTEHCSQRRHKVVFKTTTSPVYIHWQLKCAAGHCTNVNFHLHTQFHYNNELIQLCRCSIYL